MKRKLPVDAFAAYASMGVERSYRAVAEKFDVSKRAVTSLANKEQWAERLEAIEAEAQERADKRIAETLDDMNQRHLRIAKALQGKALRALQDMPLDQAKDVIRALDLGVKQERLVRGERTERQANVEEVIKREFNLWMTEGDEDDVETTDDE